VPETPTKARFPKKVNNRIMKRTPLLAIIISFTAVSAVAQHDHNNHQKASTVPDTSYKALGSHKPMEQQVFKLLLPYTNLKNALVAGDAKSAVSNSTQFLKLVNTIDFKVISEGNIHILSKNATRISETKDLNKQREYFAILSSNMVAVAKAFKLSDSPIYVQYCPMKKALWLSLEKEIQNPYYGSSMLTCGEVTGTF
jgi:hypothetical protein